MKIFFQHPGGQCELDNVDSLDTIFYIKMRLVEISSSDLDPSDIQIITANDELL